MNLKNKILTLILVFTVALSVFGCGAETDVSNTPLPTKEAENNISTESTEEAVETSAPTALATEDVNVTENEKVTDASKNSDSETKTEQETEKETEEKGLYCSLKIDCSNIFNNIEEFDENKLILLGNDGKIYSNSKIEFNEGETVLDVVIRELKVNKIHFEYTFSVTQNSSYIEGINNIYELDCGGMSGWMYCVNGEYPNCSVGDYVLKNGDSIEINYTVNMGEDLGRVYN